MIFRTTTGDEIRLAVSALRAHYSLFLGVGSDERGPACGVFFRLAALESLQQLPLPPHGSPGGAR